jgi:uncharacterized protein
MTTPARTPDPRPQVWPAFVGFGAAVMIAQLLGVVVLGSLFVARQMLSDSPVSGDRGLLHAVMEFAVSPTSVIAAAAVSSLTLLGTALVGARLSKLPAAVRLRLGPSPLGWGRAVVAVLGAVAVSWGYSAAVSLAGLDDIGMLHLFDKAFREPTPVFFALALLFIGLSAPVGEELFFRGFMQTRLAQRWSRWAAIGATAAAFGLMHMDPIQGPFAMFAGLYLGYLAEVTGSIRPAIAAHAVNNCLSVLATRLDRGDAEPSRAVHVAQLAIAAAVVIGAIVALRSVRRDLPATANGDG